jgi:hypothetical protein
MATRSAASVRAAQGRLSGLSVFLCKSVLYEAFVWARGALNRPKRRFSPPPGSHQVLLVPRHRDLHARHRRLRLPGDLPQVQGPRGCVALLSRVGTNCATRPRHESFGRNLPIRPKSRHQYMQPPYLLVTILGMNAANIACFRGHVLGGAKVEAPLGVSR